MHSLISSGPLFGLLLLAHVQVAQAGAIADMKVIAKSDSWELRQEQDSFSGKAECVIVEIGNYDVQISKGFLFIVYKGRGGVRSYRYRIDDGQPSKTILPSEVEQQIATVVLKDRAFLNILNAKRLRVQTETYFDVKQEDINLSGLRDLYSKMLVSCPDH
jgi:hypothetical protein